MKTESQFKPITASPNSSLTRTQINAETNGSSVGPNDRSAESPPVLFTKAQKQSQPQRTSFNQSLESLNSQSLYETQAKSRSRSNAPSMSTEATPRPVSLRETQPERLMSIRDFKSNMNAIVSKPPQQQPKQRKQTQNGTEYDSEGSELSAISKISSTSVLSTQSERPSRSNAKRLNPSGYMSHIDEKSPKCQSVETELNLSQQGSQTQISQPNTNANKPKLAKTKSKNSLADNTSDMNCSKTDGTLSDSALSSSTNVGDSKKRRASMAKALVILGLSRKSNSSCDLTHGTSSMFALYV